MVCDHQKKALRENMYIETCREAVDEHDYMEIKKNGSIGAVEGITSPDGRCFGKMAHAERRDTSVAINIYGEQDLKIFESGVAYFL